MENNFLKYDASTITSFGLPYDYGSVMHYEEYAFSKNGEKTIVPKVRQLLYLFWYQIWVPRQDLRFFIKAKRLIKTQNNKDR